MPVPVSPKPYKTVPEQILHLRGRGMVFADENRAAHQLNYINYYRLSAYWHPFRIRQGRVLAEEFIPGTDFNDIVKLYIFDRKLRLLVMDALERIETAFKTQIALFAGQIDPCIHLKPEMLDGGFVRNPNGYQKWRRKFDDKINDSKEDFVTHFQRNHPAESMPVWMIMELIDFGAMSQFYSGLKNQHQAQIARKFGVFKPDIMSSWVRSLNFIRNVCAHHGRLWNRVLVDLPKIPAVGEVEAFRDISYINADMQNRLYYALVIMQILMRQIAPASMWRARLLEQLEEFPPVGTVSLQDSGFPAGWRDNPIWA